MMGNMATAGGVDRGLLQFHDCGSVNGPVSIGPGPIGQDILQSLEQTLQHQEGNCEGYHQVYVAGVINA